MMSFAWPRTAVALVVSASLLGTPATHAQVRSTPSPDFNPTVDAARLLTQASFGATRAEINRVAALGANGWLNEQFAKPQVSHTQTVQDLMTSGLKNYEVTMPSVWKQYIEGNDQLRQRMVFALTQILVISQRNNIILDNPCSAASYLDMLGKHAFGNFRDILKDVTLHPAMGEYLDMKKSGRITDVTNPDGTQVSFYPNENYARELLQLFSIGTAQLNLDGTPKLDGNGKVIPTYDESIVKGFAQAFTGWTFAADVARDKDYNKPWRWLYQFYPSDVDFPDPAVRQDIMCTIWKKSMEPWTITRQQPGKWDLCDAQKAAGQTPNYNTCPKPDLQPPHDPGTKKLLNNVTLPANQTPMQDIDAAIDNIFNHANVGPFIGRQLIQRLTMSNPSGPYVERVAKAFNDNGKGVRGDMKSVIRAILLDPDVRLHVRAKGELAGKLKEPVVRWVQFNRAFNAKAVGGDYRIWDLGNPDVLNQSPLNAASVFNYYHPDNLLPGQPSYAPVTAPEFELATTNAVAGWSGFVNWGLIEGFGNGNTGADAAKHIKPDYSAYLPMAQNNPTQLIDELTVLLLDGMIDPAFRTKLIDAVGKLTLDTNNTPMNRLQMALWLIINSPDYLIQK
jgi:uncharacterized protein (DUF1800 family)